MKIRAFKFDNGHYKEIKKFPSSEEWKNNIDWIEIYDNDRKEVAGLIKEHLALEGVDEFILYPEKHPLPKKTDQYIIQNFTISNHKDIYKADFFTIIFLKQFVVCIFPKHYSYPESELLPYADQEKKDLKSMRYRMVFRLIEGLIAQIIINIGTVKKRLRKMEDTLLVKPHKLDSNKVLRLRSDVGQFADIIEDQYVGFNLLFSLYESFSDLDITGLSKLLENYKELNRIVERLEEKAETFSYHFLSVQQEASTRKINVLTILQAIFVPMTFIAGVYGMNFENMPELKWEHGYFIVLGLFLLLGIVSIVFFKVKGWFD